ncbi:MAG TPA: type II toxin-antitoxin system PemK/MazF family toxin [Pyrinomonadaceae bacterium]|nr:type II toxin-antitoxin system PemK/MazF family toxin [Pyrinomonadaceae bacterium]
MSTRSYSKGDVLLVRYPFTDLSGAKVRPAVVVGESHVSQDILIVPLTSKTASLLAGEFILADWEGTHLHVPSAVKRGIYTVHESLVARRVGKLSAADSQTLESSLRQWLGLP